MQTQNKKNTHTSSSLTLSLLRKGELPQPYIHIFMNTSDNGPDQQAVRNGIHTMFSTRNDLSFALFFAPLCLKHQFHLISQGQLKLIDDIVGGKLDFPARCQWKYYTSVATLSHTWRGHLSKLRDKWIQQHAKDPEFAGMRASFKLPPLAISGRWASIDSACGAQHSIFNIVPNVSIFSVLVLVAI